MCVCNQGAYNSTNAVNQLLICHSLGHDLLSPFICHRSNDSALRVSADGRTDGQTDGRQEVHYVPTSLSYMVDKTNSMKTKRLCIGPTCLIGNKLMFTQFLALDLDL